MTDDLITWLDQQLENQRFRAEGLKTLAFALPPEPGAVLTETAEMLLADVDAKRRILDLVLLNADGEPIYRDGYAEAWGDVVKLLAQSYASQHGYQEEWRPA